MSPLITKTDIQEFKMISDNVSSIKQLSPFIIEAQEFDLRPFMGESFFIDFMDDATASPQFTKYEDLWNGVQYTYSGHKYEHQGIKAILIYHSYARYLPHASVKSTPHGMVHKQNQYSERVSDKTIARMLAQARSGAEEHERRVRLFLQRNRSDYPLYKCPRGKKYRAGMKINKIG